MEGCGLGLIAVDVFSAQGFRYPARMQCGLHPVGIKSGTLAAVDRWEEERRAGGEKERRRVGRRATEKGSPPNSELGSVHSSLRSPDPRKVCLSFRFRIGPESPTPVLPPDVHGDHHSRRRNPALVQSSEGWHTQPSWPQSCGIRQPAFTRSAMSPTSVLTASSHVSSFAFSVVHRLMACPSLSSSQSP